MHTPQSWPTPGYEREGAPYPIFQALKSLTGLGGKPMREVSVSEPGLVEAVAADTGGSISLVVANLTASAQVIDVGGRTERLEAYGFARLAC